MESTKWHEICTAGIRWTNRAWTKGNLWGHSDGNLVVLDIRTKSARQVRK